MNLRIGGGGIESTFKAINWAIEKSPIQHMDKLVDIKSIIENLFIEEGLIGRKQLDEMEKQ